VSACPHGSLARSCPRCEDAETIAFLRGQLRDANRAGEAAAEERQRDAESALSALQVAALAAAEHRATVAGLAGRLAAATPEERRRVLLALCPRRGVDGLRLRADGTWDLRGIRPAAAALSSPEGGAAAEIVIAGGPARCRGWRRRA